MTPKGKMIRRHAEEMVRFGMPVGLSVGKQWKWKRDVCIFALINMGISQRYIAEVFDLPRSRIASIVKEKKAIFGDPES